jgi:hypothetical protein
MDRCLAIHSDRCLVTPTERSLERQMDVCWAVQREIPMAVL